MHPEFAPRVNTSPVNLAMGIDPSMTFPNQTGRPMYILDDREPVTELL
jgi:hypothetical protein